MVSFFYQVLWVKEPLPLEHILANKTIFVLPSAQGTAGVLCWQVVSFFYVNQ